MTDRDGAARVLADGFVTLNQQAAASAVAVDAGVANERLRALGLNVDHPAVTIAGFVLSSLVGHAHRAGVGYALAIETLENGWADRANEDACLCEAVPKDLAEGSPEFEVLSLVSHAGFQCLYAISEHVSADADVDLVISTFFQHLRSLFAWITPITDVAIQRGTPSP